MNNIRCYDDDPDFRAFLTLLEKQRAQVQEEIATDILLNISRFVYENNDSFLNNIKTSPSYKRWYDRSPQIHCAIEELRKLDKNMRDEMIASVSDIFFANYKES